MDETLTPVKNMAKNNEEKETLFIDINLPLRAQRVTTALFVRTRKELIAREEGRCFVCGRTDEETGHPLEAHHVWIEHCLANGVDWACFRDAMFKFEKLVTICADFCRNNLNLDDITAFVDDQTVNGMLLCKEHHTNDGKDIPCGIHTMTFPLWFFQAYAVSGFQFTSTEAIVHECAQEPVITLQTTVTEKVTAVGTDAVVTAEKTTTDTTTITPKA